MTRVALWMVRPGLLSLITPVPREHNQIPDGGGIVR